MHELHAEDLSSRRKRSDGTVRAAAIGPISLLAFVKVRIPPRLLASRERVTHLFWIVGFVGTPPMLAIVEYSRPPIVAYI